MFADSSHVGSLICMLADNDFFYKESFALHFIVNYVGSNLLEILCFFYYWINHYLVQIHAIINPIEYREACQCNSVFIP